MTATQWKLLAFVFLWHELAKCLNIGADEAFINTLVLFFGTAVVRRFGIEIAGMSAPLTAAFATRAVLWLVVYFALAPAFIRNLPFSITLAGCLGLAFAGAAARDWFFVWVQGIDSDWIRDRSEWTVAIVMNALGCCFVAQMHWGSVLPLVGYLLLPGLPLSIGWLARAPEVQWRWDARFGTEEMFHDVGASDEV
jgi:hypothetical protein